MGLKRSTPLTASTWTRVVAGGGFLLLAGHLAPWAAHRTAALSLSANDLAFFTHFTPGAGIFKNEWFYLPIWMAAILFGVLAGRSMGLSRWLWLVVGWGIAALGLPRYDQWAKLLSGATSLRQMESGLQLVLSLLAMGFALVVALAFTRLNARRSRAATLLGAAMVGVAALGSAVPLVGYLSIKPALEALYGGPVGLGLGWWITLGAVLALWAAAFVRIMRARVHQHASEAG